MRGSLSGNQSLQYGGVSAYDIADGERVSADAYQPRVIAKVLRAPYATRRRYFQIRTRTTVNMSPAMRTALAVMGGAGAIFAALLRNKDAAIYRQCVNACPKHMTLRQFVLPPVMAGLRTKSAQLTISDGLYIVNPWISSETPSVTLPANIIDKFASELGTPQP